MMHLDKAQWYLHCITFWRKYVNKLWAKVKYLFFFPLSVLHAEIRALGQGKDPVGLLLVVVLDPVGSLRVDAVYPLL